MPIAKKYTISQVLEACRNYYEKTGRRITFEYALVGGENDSQEDAKHLAELIKGLNCHVNLIPVNPIKERSYVRSDKKVIGNFKINLKNTKLMLLLEEKWAGISMGLWAIKKKL